MSPDTPSPRRRRRIAGERQGRAGTPADQPAPAASAGAPPGAVKAAKREETEAPRRDDPPGREQRPAAVRPPVPGWVLAALGAVTAALVVVATVGVADGMGIRGYQELQEQQEVEQARRTAPAAAERAAAAILAYDYRSLNADRKAAGQFMTEQYRAQYRKTFKNLVPANARKLEAVVTADVKASGVVHADPDRANVLLFVNQRTVSTAHEEPQLALNRVVLAMKQRDDTWLVDGITAY